MVHHCSLYFVSNQIALKWTTTNYKAIESFNENGAFRVLTLSGRSLQKIRTWNIE